MGLWWLPFLDFAVMYSLVSCLVGLTFLLRSSGYFIHVYSIVCLPVCFYVPLYFCRVSNLLSVCLTLSFCLGMCVCLSVCKAICYCLSILLVCLFICKCWAVCVFVCEQCNFFMYFLFYNYFSNACTCITRINVI